MYRFFIKRSFMLSFSSFILMCIILGEHLTPVVLFSELLIGKISWRQS